MSSFLLLQEELNRGKPNWEHLNEELHVLISCEDTENRARVKLQRAKEEIEKLLIPAVSDIFDSLAKKITGAPGELLVLPEFI